MLYVFRVNLAFAALGVQPAKISQIHRTAAQSLGVAMGRSPQEAALLTVAGLPAQYRMNADRRAVEKWIKQRKIDPGHSAIREALCEVGFPDLCGD